MNVVHLARRNLDATVSSVMISFLKPGAVTRPVDCVHLVCGAHAPLCELHAELECEEWITRRRNGAKKKRREARGQGEGTGRAGPGFRLLWTGWRGIDSGRCRRWPLVWIEIRGLAVWIGV